jgi:hypothetical protein
MLLNGAAQIEETALRLHYGCQFPWCALALSFFDGTSIIMSHLEIEYFQSCMNDVFASFSKRFKASELTLNVDKTNFVLTAELALI